MTVCIAAAANFLAEPKLVLCTDWLVSGSLGRAESALKMRSISNHWFLLTAGDLDEFRETVISMRNVLTRMEINHQIVDETNILQIARDELQRRKKQKADDIAYANYAISYDDLLKTGRDRLPDGEFRETVSEIRSARLRADFLLCGFCESFPVIIEMRSDFTAVIREEFATIGSGGYLAQSVLLHRAHTDIRSLNETLYTVFEAKKVAERDVSVGEATTLSVASADGSLNDLTPAGKRWLESEFKELGPRPLKTSFTPPEGILKSRKSPASDQTDA